MDFINSFLIFAALAGAKLSDVLKIWQGLGYNRRGKYLWESAKIVVEQYNGKLPESIEELQKLPGIGYATSCSISAFAFNTPTVFIETNIRSVFIHFFFHDKENISDAQLLPLIQASVDGKRSREWYWALMDYGAMLKKTKTNPNRRSKPYVKQSTFEGSHRQIRGNILKLVLAKKQSKKQLINELKVEPQRLTKALEELDNEGLIAKENRFYRIA